MQRKGFGRSHQQQQEAAWCASWRLVDGCCFFLFDGGGCCSSGSKLCHATLLLLKEVGMSSLEHLWLYKPLLFVCSVTRLGVWREYNRAVQCASAPVRRGAARYGDASE